MLHVYWTLLMFKIIFSIVFKGHVDDLVNKNKLSSEGGEVKKEIKKE